MVGVSIASEDPYEKAARQLLEQAPRSPEYVPDPMELEDHVPVYIPEPEHPEDLVPAEDEAPIEAYITEVASAPPPPPSFLPSLIRPPRTRAAMAQMRAAAPSTYHPLLPSGTPPLLPIPLPAPSTSRRADIPEADTPPWKRLLLTAPRPRCEVGESSAAAAARQPGPTMARRVDYSSVDTVDVCNRESSEFYSRHHDAQKDRAAVRAEIETMAPKRATRLIPVTTTPAPTSTTTTSVTNAQLQAMIDQGVTAALVARDANRNGDAGHTSGTDCQVVDDAYAMTWAYLRKKTTDKYCSRNEMKKLEAELWNLKVKGTDVIGYNQRFQELALLCVRMFLEESDKIERDQVSILAKDEELDMECTKVKSLRQFTV
ncbi:hypothetical protein Tco_0576043 [Tanacetum coccineum]